MYLALTCLLFFLFSPLQALSFKDKIREGKAGDFIVTEQSKNYSLLFIRQISESDLLLEEITAPENQIDQKNSSWQEWVNQGAPGHSSWLLYTIDLEKNELKEIFSFLGNGWIYSDESDSLLTKLLALPLSKIPQDERRRIGPAPLSEESDHRALWNPPLVLEGKKREKALFEVFKTRWLSDETRLSGCHIDLYFDAARTHFPFPYWIEIKSPHYTLNIRTVDSGSGMLSSQLSPPQRALEFLGLPQKLEGKLRLTIKNPHKGAKLHLFAVDLAEPNHLSYPISYELQPTFNREIFVLQLSDEELSKTLVDRHYYRWVVVPEGSHHLDAQMNTPFLWKTPSVMNKTLHISTLADAVPSQQ